MKKSHLILLIILLPIVALSQEDDDIKWYLNLPEISIYAERPLKEIGVQKTKMDSIVLKENIALSVADILTFSSPIFVKNYGRATLSTVAFRETSASHTQVSWNVIIISKTYTPTALRRKPI